MFKFVSKFHSARFLGRLLRIPLRLIPPGLVVPTISGLNQGMKWRVGASVHGCWLGFYEKDKQELLARVVQPSMRVFDIGANAGFYTLALSRLVGKTGKVWSFEPFAANVVSILEHIRINQCDNVALIQAAVSNSNDLAGFDIGENNSIGALGSNQDYMIPTISLDGLLDRGVIEMPDVIKMDVEGAESRVLAGATRILRNHATIWVIALHGTQQRESVISILESSGYRIFSLEGIEITKEFMGDEIWAVPTKLLSAELN